MKYLLLLTVYIINQHFVCSQSFNGRITYENSYTSLNSSVSSNQMNQLLGTTQEYYISDMYYKSVTNGYVKMQLYDSKTNRIYHQFSVNDSLYWIDAAINTDTVLDFAIIENVGEILGTQCNALMIETINGKITYFFSSKYPIYSSHFDKHKYSNWAFYLSKTQAIPLKILVENKQFKMKSVAVKLEVVNFNPDFFKTPNNIQISNVSH